MMSLDHRSTRSRAALMPLLDDAKSTMENNIKKDESSFRTEPPNINDEKEDT